MSPDRTRRQRDCRTHCDRDRRLVVEDAAGLARARLAKNPLLLRVQKGLRRPPFDGAAQRLLPSIGLGQIVLIEEKQANRKGRGDGDNGRYQAVQADASAFMATISLLRFNTPKVTSAAISAAKGAICRACWRQIHQVIAHCDQRNVVAQMSPTRSKKVKTMISSTNPVRTTTNM